MLNSSSSPISSLLRRPIFLGLESSLLLLLLTERIFLVYQLIPTAQEKADLESQRADTADRKAEGLAAQLRSLGIEPDIESNQ
jgi:hypothetical protein